MGPTNGCWRRWAPRSPRILLTAAKTGLAAHLFSVHPRPAPTWYFAANAATTFVLAFLVPFFFFRSNVRAEASLQRIGQWKLKRVIDADLIGVVRGRLSGCIEDANDTFLSLLGYTRQDLAAGALDLGMIAPSGSLLTELPQRGPTSVYELVCRRKDGTTVPALVGVARLDESDDSTDEVVGFILDLTAQKHLEAQRAMLHDSREELRLRDLFNSIASHELKTPLTALLLNLRLLSARLDKETPPTSPLRAQVVRCEAAAARMAGLIHALLDVAQVHRGQLTLDVRETDVVDAVRSVVSGFDGNRNDNGTPIALRTEEHFTAKLDPLRFDQVVTNLLSNAVKYGARQADRGARQPRSRGRRGAPRGHRRRPRHRSGDDAEDLRAVPASHVHGTDPRDGPRSLRGEDDRGGSRRSNRGRHRAGAWVPVHRRSPLRRQPRQAQPEFADARIKDSGGARRGRSAIYWSSCELVVPGSPAVDLRQAGQH